MSELCAKMTQNKAKNRPQSCRQILDDKHLWSLNEKDFDLKKEFKNLSKQRDKQYMKSYNYKLIKCLILNEA